MILDMLLKNAESAELTIKMLTERLAALRSFQGMFSLFSCICSVDQVQAVCRESNPHSKKVDSGASEPEGFL